MTTKRTTLSGEAPRPFFPLSHVQNFFGVAGSSVDSLEVLGWRWVGSCKHLFLKSIGSCDPTYAPLDGGALRLPGVRAEQFSTFCFWEAVLAVDNCQGDQILHNGQERHGIVYFDCSLSSMAEIPIYSVPWSSKESTLDLHGNIVQHLTVFTHREWCTL